jgi:hypothetical protein
MYSYKVEENISWERRFLWEGKIEVGSKSVSVKTTAPCE